MSYIPSNTSDVSYFDIIGVNEREVEALVVLKYPKFHSAISKLAAQMPNGIQKKSGNPIFEIYRQGNYYASSTIATSATVGGNKVVTFSDSTFEAIPVGNMVYDENSTAIGKVISKSAGNMTIGFVANANTSYTSFQSGDFAVGYKAIDGGDMGSNDDRVSKEYIMRAPDKYRNIVGSMNQTVSLTHNDFFQKQYLAGSSGSGTYALTKEMQALNVLQQQYTKRMLSNTPAVFSGSEPVGSSLLNQILTMDGIYRPLSSTLTLAEIKSATKNYGSKGSASTNELVIFGGIQYVAEFQDALESYVTTAGDKNTVGGVKVDGLNVFSYGYAGYDLKLVHDPVLDYKEMWGTNADGYSKRSRSAIWMNTSPVEAEQGGTLPFICDYYFGVNADIQRLVIEGFYNDKGQRVQVGANGKKGATVEFTWDKQTQLSNPSATMYHGS